MKVKELIKFKPLELIKADNDIIGTSIKKGDVVLYLGEIANMKEHIVFVTKDNKTYFGYHPENFIKLKKEEI